MVNTAGIRKLLICARIKHFLFNLLQQSVVLQHILQTTQQQKTTAAHLDIFIFNPKVFINFDSW